MAYSILHLSRNNQRTHLIVDDVTTLPVMFATIYGMNELSKKHLGTQENILCSLRFFYVYYFKKHKRTFDYDFYRSGYNISCFIRELDGFFTYLLGKQHLSDETDIISTGFLHSALSRTNKSTYGNHVRNVGRFLKYLNYRYMNLAYQDMSPVEAHQSNQANHRDLADRIKVFNRVEVSRNEPAHRYKSITSQQSVELTNMLLHKRFLLATFCALFTATLQAADVTITVNGRVVAKPCTIQTKEANVNLGDLYTRNLQQPGSASGWHNITLSLTDCPVETSVVTAIVTGSTDNTGYYKNEGTAENIQIELRDDQDATLKNGDSKTVIVDEITRNAQFPLKARAITVNGNASQGTIEALINVIYTWQ